MLVFAPLIGWLMARYGGFLLPREGDELVGVWRDVTFSLPSRLVQGFGFNASTALERGVGGVILGSPRNAALQIWLELGIVGVLLAAAALYFSVFAVERVDDKARAGRPRGLRLGRRHHVCRSRRLAELVDHGHRPDRHHAGVPVAPGERDRG